VVTGLAWTAVGGEILFVESSLSRGKESKLTLTGNLGDVMKESAMLAMEYIRSHADELGIDPKVFEQWTLTFTFPKVQFPKTVPSAGLTNDETNLPELGITRTSYTCTPRKRTSQSWQMTERKSRFGGKGAIP
jgi:ATP-dependent Lon protease